MIYVVGCSIVGLVCNSEMFIVNGASQSVQSYVPLEFAAYPRVTLNPNTHVVYVTGDAQLVEFDGTTAPSFLTTTLEFVPYISPFQKAGSLWETYNYFLLPRSELERRF